jgi:hypothetical protein
VAPKVVDVINRALNADARRGDTAGRRGGEWAARLDRAAALTAFGAGTGAGVLLSMRLHRARWRASARGLPAALRRRVRPLRRAHSAAHDLPAAIEALEQRQLARGCPISRTARGLGA